MSPNALTIDRAVTAALAADRAGDGTALASIRQEVQREQRPLLVMLKVLGPNPRAITLGIAVLNVLLVLAVRREDAAAMRVVERLRL